MLTWVILLILGVVITVTVVLIYVFFPDPPSDPPPPPKKKLFEPCEIGECQDNLVCTHTSEGNKCLTKLGGICRLDRQCASGYCHIIGKRGICANRVFQEGGIYTWNNYWQRILPSPVTFKKVVASGKNIFGFAVHPYLYTPETGWQNLLPLSPGELITGTFNGEVYLVYKHSNSTPLYRFYEDSIIPYDQSTGGVQVTRDGSHIIITDISISRGNIYLVGSVQGSYPTIFLRKAGENFYTPIASGDKLTLAPGVWKNEDYPFHAYAYYVNRSIFYISEHGTRLDDVNDVTSIAVTPNKEIWYVSDGNIYMNHEQRGQGNYVFYSEYYGLCKG